MGDTARKKRNKPQRPPVEIQLNEGHVGRRLAAAVVLLVLGAAMLVYAFMQLMEPGDEWITIEASSSQGTSCAPEFSFLYRPGSGELSYSADRKAATALYSQLCREAYERFHPQEAFEGVNNIYAINRHPNEVLEVDEGLYQAFSTVDRSGSRAIYLGPVYVRYDDLFFCENDSQLADFDPRLSGEVAEEYREILRFANDPQSIRLELLGEGRIRLYVSEEYLAWARQEGIEDFVDFAWMRNAFIADFIAEALAAEGYTHGVLSSYDGFIRNLDGSGRAYSMQVYDRDQAAGYTAAVMGYQGPMSIVSLWDFPVNELDAYRFYALRNGEIRNPYLDPADALCKSAVHDLVGYAQDKSCGEILLALMPAYIAEEIRTEELIRLAGEGVQSVFCQGGVVRYTDPAAQFSRFYNWRGAPYTASQLEQ